MVVLASSVEHVIGIDPDRDRVTASVVDTATTGEQATAVFETTRKGYERLLKWADRPPDRRSSVVRGRHRKLRSRPSQLPHFSG